LYKNPRLKIKSSLAPFFSEAELGLQAFPTRRWERDKPLTWLGKTMMVPLTFNVEVLDI